MQKREFKAEIAEMLDLVVNSLYSKKEIYLRELISNASDAIDKAKFAALTDKTLVGDNPEWKIEVAVDKTAKTLMVSDNGIGMDAEELERNLGTIASSGTKAFRKALKENDGADLPELIGQFGVGFYAAFMVADKVEIFTQSYKADAKPVHWVCDGSPEYQMEECEKAERGTVITLYIAEDEKEFAQKSRISGLLSKYCKFMPVPVIFGKEQEWKDGKYVDTDKDNVINKVEPLWARKPSDLTEDDYKTIWESNVDYATAVTPKTISKLKSVIPVAEGAVEGEEAFRAKVKEGIQAQHVLDSDYKFLLDLRAYCEAKVGEVEFPNEVLKKVMLNNNKEKGEALTLCF